MPEPAPTLIVSADDIARRLGVPRPLDPDDEWLIEQAIAEGQAGLEAYLGRPVAPRAYTDQHVRRYRYPGADEWRLSETPVQSVTTVTEETDADGDPTGLYTVEYIAGLDGANDPDLAPLRRYVRAAAIYSPEVRAWFKRVAPELARQITNLSVDGQSVTYSDTYAVPPGGGAGAADGVGQVPPLSSCDRWRIAGRRVYQRPTPLGPGWWPCRDWAYEWPYGGGF
ncbi:hypothetical protein [Actinomadura violacea]|uniref:Uncharacterized protein n=1 Tax=Actinomadura violacea TaxID=2819934 RepID=A0ABS3RY45_9ACTN|nr:hypothetical protein [Actinomadura violacea]MBO2461683.1 hypothetical protein [Actinomadura violacea]